MADTKLSDLTELSIPAFTDWLYAVDDPAGSPASFSIAIERLLGLLTPLCQGRLTTESGVPVSTSDRTSQGTIYFTPYNGNVVSLYDGTRWKAYPFTERSLALTVTSGSTYDVFLYDNAGTLTLELSGAWTNDTTRADSLALQDGVPVKSGATTRRWLGTITASGSNVTEDSAAKRYVWNRYNQVRLSLRNATETTDSWPYSTDTFRQANANAANQLDYVTGDAATLVEARVLGSAFSATTGIRATVGVGIDSTTVNSAQHYGGNNTGGSIGTMTHAEYRGYPGLGRHSLVWLEKASASTVTWRGDQGGTDWQTGISGWLLG